MAEAMTLTHQAAALLLSAATKVAWPATLGSGQYALVFDDQERASIMESVVELRDTLRRKSTLKGKEWCIGEATNWEPKPDEPTRHALKDLGLPLEVSVSPMGLVGMYWLLLWMMHPASPAFQPGGIQEEVIYPLVRMLGKEESLRYDLGLLDDEPAETKKN